AGRALTSGPLIDDTEAIAVERRRRRKADPAATATAARDRSGAGPKTVLVVEDDPVQREHILAMAEPINAAAVGVASGEDALEELSRRRFDCVVVDLGLPGLSGWEVIDHIRGNPALRSIPLVVYTARDLTRKEELRLNKATKSIVVKEIRSLERMRDELTSLLAQPQEAPAASSANRNGHTDPALAGKKVLVVDDDIRNIFALPALLERQGVEVISVDNGQDAIRIARDDVDVRIALIDVMMPEMDGYATMRHMRELPTFKDQPIV